MLILVSSETEDDTAPAPAPADIRSQPLPFLPQQWHDPRPQQQPTATNTLAGDRTLDTPIVRCGHSQNLIFMYFTYTLISGYSLLELWYS